MSVKTCYFISSHPSETRHLLAMARTHWSIETGLHWVLGVAFREDASRVRTGHAPVTRACCGAWHSTCSQQDTTRQGRLAVRCRKTGCKLTYMEQVLGLASLRLPWSLRESVVPLLLYNRCSPRMFGSFAMECGDPLGTGPA